MRLIFLLSTCAWAQLVEPQIGTMLDAHGASRPVFGVAASVTLGDPLALGVVSMACFRDSCVAKTGTAVVGWNQTGLWSKDVPGRHAMFAFGNDSIYMYRAGVLTRDFEPFGLNVDGKILSMRVVNGVLEFAVRRDDGVWIVRDGNAVTGALPDATGPVLLLDHAVVFASGEEIVLRRDDASEIRFPVRAIGFIAMGDGFVQIRSRGSSYALRVAPGREKLFLLPEAQ